MRDRGQQCATGWVPWKGLGTTTGTFPEPFVCDSSLPSDCRCSITHSIGNLARCCLYWASWCSVLLYKRLDTFHWPSRVLSIGNQHVGVVCLSLRPVWRRKTRHSRV